MSLIIPEEVEKLENSYQEIENTISKLNVIKDKFKKEIENCIKNNAIVECNCGHKENISDLLNVKELFSSEKDYDNDCFYYKYEYYWVCQGCYYQFANYDLSELKQVTSESIRSVLREPILWDTFHHNSAPKELKKYEEMINQRKEEAKKKEKELEYKRKIEEAKKLLKDAGEL